MANSAAEVKSGVITLNENRAAIATGGRLDRMDS
jgi:hypothetical protein